MLLSSSQLKIDELFSEEGGASPVVKMQMAFLLGRQRSSYQLEDEKLNEIIGNATLSVKYFSLSLLPSSMLITCIWEGICLIGKCLVRSLAAIL